MSAFRSINPEPVRYASSGPDRTSTPIVRESQSVGESGAGKTVNISTATVGGDKIVLPTGESDAGKTVKPTANTESGDGAVNDPKDAILARVKGCSGPPFNPFKWKLVDMPPPIKLEPATFHPNPKLLGHINRKKSMDSGDFNMFRYTNMRNGIFYNT